MENRLNIFLFLLSLAWRKYPRTIKDDNSERIYVIFIGLDVVFYTKKKNYIKIVHLHAVICRVSTWSSFCGYISCPDLRCHVVIFSVATILGFFSSSNAFQKIPHPSHWVFRTTSVCSDLLPKLMSRYAHVYAHLANYTKLDLSLLNSNPHISSHYPTILHCILT